MPPCYRTPNYRCSANPRIPWKFAVVAEERNEIAASAFHHNRRHLVTTAKPISKERATNNSYRIPRAEAAVSREAATAVASAARGCGRPPLVPASTMTDERTDASQSVGRANGKYGHSCWRLFVFEVNSRPFTDRRQLIGGLACVRPQITRLASGLRSRLSFPSLLTHSEYDAGRDWAVKNHSSPGRLFGYLDLPRERLLLLLFHDFPRRQPQRVRSVSDIVRKTSKNDGCTDDCQSSPSPRRKN
ncbi:unnamed protein product [Soboliphyme baturini]|uniref:Uncharacterized protein n=1 Tax=Soboliphyme baturini TaxID=241478 RepID=A0A183J8S4_9BILA|nr:unnamed protein product [Soboliphyme baturini]